MIEPTTRVLRRAATLLFFFLSATTAIAEPAPSIDVDRLKAHVEFLASDLLEGRVAGSRGHEIAARYVASQFQQLGARPAGENGTWLQAVPLLEAMAVIPAGSVRLDRSGSTMELVNTEDLLPRANYAEPSATVTARALFVGHGVSAPELKYDDFAGIDVSGRIAVVLSGAPPTFPNDQRAYYSSSSYKFRTLAERGAAGVIFVDTPIDEKRTPWERTVLLSWQPSMRWVDRNGVPFEAFPDLRGRFAFSRAGALKLFAGSPVSLETTFANSEAGKPKSFELPVTVTLASKTTSGRTSSVNVVALIEGSDPTLKSEYVVFSAHLDHLGKGAPVNGDAIYNGAFDNSTGTAILLETARYFAALERKPAKAVMRLDRLWARAASRGTSDRRPPSRTTGRTGPGCPGTRRRPRRNTTRRGHLSEGDSP